MKLLLKNKKVSHDYIVLEKFTCGLVLKGTEVKSVKYGKSSIKESFCYFKNKELFVKGMHIAEHTVGEKHDVNREKKLLLTKKELKKLSEQVSIKGLTIIPIEVFINDKNYIKMVIGLCKGKQSHDKRNTIKLKDIQREVERKIK